MVKSTPKEEQPSVGGERGRPPPREVERRLVAHGASRPSRARRQGTMYEHRTTTTEAERQATHLWVTSLRRASPYSAALSVRPTGCVWTTRLSVKTVN